MESCDNKLADFISSSLEEYLMSIIVTNDGLKTIDVLLDAVSPLKFILRIGGMKEARISPLKMSASSI